MDIINILGKRSLGKKYFAQNLVNTEGLGYISQAFIMGIMFITNLLTKQTMDYIKIIAIISAILSVFNVIAVPAILGKSRGNYTYSTFISEILSAILIVLMALRIFGVI
jgi:hypothetical protein